MLMNNSNFGFRRFTSVTFSALLASEKPIPKEISLFFINDTDSRRSHYLTISFLGLFEREEHQVSLLPRFIKL